MLHKYAFGKVTEMIPLFQPLTAVNIQFSTEKAFNNFFNKSGQLGSWSVASNCHAISLETKFTPSLVPTVLPPTILYIRFEFGLFSLSQMLCKKR